MGRIAIVFMALVGTLPLIAGPSALDATTVSGTMVVGLGGWLLHTVLPALYVSVACCHNRDQTTMLAKQCVHSLQEAVLLSPYR